MKRYWAMKWAADLERRGLRQAKESLTDGKGGFCCLGRLCVVAGALREGTEFDGECIVLPPSILLKTGMKDDCGILPNGIAYSGHVCGALTELNDAGMPFREIAKIIRKHWKEL